VRVFITGADGFIGGALAERLRADGHEVAGVDLADGDIAVPGPWQRRARGCDLAVHTAAFVSLRDEPEAAWRANVLGTRHALDAAVTGGAKRFVHLSSIVVFGNRFPDGVSERHPVHPNGVPYVDTKIASEQVVLAAHAAGEIECAVVRPGDVYGPRSRPWAVLPVEEMKANRLVLPARGRGIHSPVYVDDVVEGIRLAATSPAAAGQIFTITGAEAVQTRDFFEHYARLLGKSVRTAPTPVVAALAAVAGRLSRGSEVTPAAVRYMTRTGGYSIEKARTLLGYEPAVELEEGMRRTADWLRAEGLV
jgi:nucleoside-diphosphate-sugar epimerase